MEYTYKFNIIEIVPYNVESQQRDIIKQFSWKIIGTKGEKSASRGGAIIFDVDDGVTKEDFLPIESITNTTLQNWVENRCGETRINELKNEIVYEVENTPSEHPTGME